MESVHEVFASWEARIAGDPERARAVATTYLFLLSDFPGNQPDGARNARGWLVSLKEPLGVKEAVSSELSADCTITITSKDLISIARGDLNPQVAFLEGRIQIGGSMERAIGLSFFLPR